MAAETKDNPIQTFDPVILPRLLFVAYDCSRDEISERLKDYDNDSLLINPKDIEESEALTFTKVRGEDGSYGVLVWMHDKSKIDVKHVAHEAVHAASAIMSQCGIRPDADNDETQAYLVGFCADCIWKTCHNQSSD